MAVPKSVTWPLEPHTAAKHVILGHYLKAWFPILSQSAGAVVYMDGFSGPGSYTEGEKGSPILALDTAVEHEKIPGPFVFEFNDADQDRVDHLKGLIDAMNLPKERFRVTCTCDSFQARMERILGGMDKAKAEGRRTPPVFAFIDPFGPSGVPFTQLKRLLAFPSTEVFVNVMVESANRWVNHENFADKMREMWGVEDVLASLPKDEGKREIALRKLYETQLNSIAQFVRYFEMRNDSGKVIYDLHFGTNHPKGFVKMKESMWNADASGSFSFSDATDPDAPVLFETRANVEGLAAGIAAKFAGQEVTGADVETWVLHQTAYIGKHKTAALKLMEGDERLRVAALKTSGAKRTSGYPADAVLTFS